MLDRASRRADLVPLPRLRRGWGRLVEIVDVSVPRRRVELKLVSSGGKAAPVGAPRPAPRAAVEWSPRAGLARQKEGARQITKAALGRRGERSSSPSSSRGGGGKPGRPMLKVSHAKSRPKR